MTILQEINEIQNVLQSNGIQAGVIKFDDFPSHIQEYDIDQILNLFSTVTRLYSKLSQRVIDEKKNSAKASEEKDS